MGLWIEPKHNLGVNQAIREYDTDLANLISIGG
jgi:hypothetical protein